MTAPLEALRAAIPALELGLDALSAEAAAYHEAMKGYRPLEHAQRDADVATAQKALDAARAVIAVHPEAEPPAPNNSAVICPQCCHQFRAIPADVQHLMLDAGFEPPFVAAPQAPSNRPATSLEGSTQIQTEASERKAFDERWPDHSGSTFAEVAWWAWQERAARAKREG